MQQYPNQGTRFANTPQPAPVRRFPQNNGPIQPYEHQGQTMPQQPPLCADCPHFKEAQRRRRKTRTSLVTKLLAFIGLVTVLVQAARYVVIPLLVQLNVMAGGTL